MTAVNRICMLTTLATAALIVPVGAAQSAAATDALRKLHDRVAKPMVTLSAEDAAKALAELDALKLTDAALKPDDKARAAGVRTLAALAAGDAAGAGKHLAEMQTAAATAPSTLEIAWLVACAAGDAKVGDEALRKLGDKADGQAKKLIARRRQWLASVGRDAPEITIRTDDGNEFAAAKRGDQLLLIDFWNVLAAPTREESADVVKLYQALKATERVEFVGVNADVESRMARAKEFAEKSGYVWPQCYEAPADKAPITSEAFRAGAPPWLVLIDTYGFIRAAGDAREPGFQYAVRAALAEAEGKYPPVMPSTREGKRAAEPGKPSAADGKKSFDKPAAGEKELPSDPEAAKLLREAHAFRKTGMKTKARETYQKIINEFPGTKEAKDAQFWLED